MFSVIANTQRVSPAKVSFITSFTLFLTHYYSKYQKHNIYIEQLSCALLWIMARWLDSQSSVSCFKSNVCHNVCVYSRRLLYCLRLNTHKSFIKRQLQHFSHVVHTATVIRMHFLIPTLCLVQENSLNFLLSHVEPRSHHNFHEHYKGTHEHRGFVLPSTSYNSERNLQFIVLLLGRLWRDMTQ